MNFNRLLVAILLMGVTPLATGCVNSVDSFGTSIHSLVTAPSVPSGVPSYIKAIPQFKTVDEAIKASFAGPEGARFAYSSGWSIGMVTAGKSLSEKGDCRNFKLESPDPKERRIGVICKDPSTVTLNTK